MPKVTIEEVDDEGDSQPSASSSPRSSPSSWSSDPTYTVNTTSHNSNPCPMSSREPDLDRVTHSPPSESSSIPNPPTEETATDGRSLSSTITLYVMQDPAGEVSFGDIPIQHIGVSSLRVMLASHRVPRGRHRNKSQLLLLARHHTCTPVCATVKFRLAHAPATPEQPTNNDYTRERLLALLQSKVMAKFPQRLTDDRKRQIVEKWIDRFSNVSMATVVCACCSELVLEAQSVRTDLNASQLHVLTNPRLPRSLHPLSYDLSAVKFAILDPKGIDFTSLEPDGSPTSYLICKSCMADLSHSRLPPLALANDNYLGTDRVPPHIRTMFREASPVELSLIARYRVRCTIHKFSMKPGTPQYGSSNILSQRFLRGNTITFSNECGALLEALPPSPDVVGESICVIFVGSVYPSPEDLKRLTPLLARRNVVYMLLTWLKANNPHYADVTISMENLDALLPSPEAALPKGVHIEHLKSEPIDAESAGYVRDNMTTPDNAIGIPMTGHGVVAQSIEGISQSAMKTAAIRHWKAGGGAYTISHGVNPVSEFDNPALFPCMFPQRFPYGIGGLEDSNRLEPITLQAHIKHLLNLSDMSFQTDSSFSFVAMNILQRRRSSRAARFKVKKSTYRRTVDLLCSAEASACDSLIERSRTSNGRVDAQNQAERDIFELMRYVNMVSSDVPGSAASKAIMRNEIRSLIQWLGTPTFFVTINPADVYSPIFCHFAGERVDLDSTSPELPSEFQRRLLLARNPAAGARFFHAIMQAFIDVVLDMDCPEGGLLGPVSGYYGAIEAQGRGSLHCHMLIWISGGPGPQALHDSLQGDASFRTELFEYLEDTIRTGLPGCTKPVPRSEADFPERPDDEPHPCTLRCPDPREGNGFDEEWARQLYHLIIDCNYHVHSETCWKKLKEGEPRDDQHCRMGIDGSTRGMTIIDPETGSILLRHFHPFINNYNELIIMLTRCNMDIKFIGSGRGAKALVYYVTEYITKSSLPTHVAFSALQIVMQRVQSEDDDSLLSDAERRGRRALLLACNALLGNQELSGQQVSMHLLQLASGDGDHYTSHTFRILHWASVQAWARANESGSAASLRTESDAPDPPPANDVPPNENESDEGSGLSERSTPEPENPLLNDRPARVGDAEEEVVINLSNPHKMIVPESQLTDYRLRGAEMDDMPLYWFVAGTEKCTGSSDALRKARRQQPVGGRGRKPQPRVPFLSDHPQYLTHLIRMRTQLVVPVILGPSLPPRMKGEEYFRDMVLLFKPWRTWADIRLEGQSWSDVFLSTSFSDRSKEIMAHMNHLDECKDASTEYRALRRQGVVKTNLISDALIESHTTVPVGGENNDSDVLAIIREMAPHLLLNALPSEQLTRSNVMSAFRQSERAKKAEVAVSNARRRGLNARTQRSDDTPLADNASVVDIDSRTLDARRDYMTRYKKSLAAGLHPETNEPVYPVPRLIRGQETEPEPAQLMFDQHVNAIPLTDMVVDEVADAYHLNEEQRRAFTIIAEHKMSANPTQLMLIIAGAGGTGKSSVIAAVSAMFRRLNKENELRKVAPTGIAAYAIGGATIHSLLNLGGAVFTPTMLENAQNRLAGVTHIVLDEFSMVGSSLLSTMSTRLGMIKASSQPFGGMHMVFSGDPAQLPPVRDTVLWSGVHRSNEHVAMTAAPRKKGQYVTHGQGLWRQIDQVVLLTENHRARQDPAYVATVDRVRRGKATKEDHEKFLERDVSTATIETSQWIDVPLVTADKVLRDKWNTAAVESFAERTSQMVHEYIAVDKMKGKLVDGDLRKALLDLPSSAATKDRLGRLPLVRGLRVMILHNILTEAGVVNGAEGTVERIVYDTDSDGLRVPVMVEVHVPDSSISCPGLAAGIVPIFPDKTNIQIRTKQQRGVTFVRTQLPILPAYAFTDFKSQSRTLSKVVIDLESARRSLESAYVMVSRAVSWHGVLLLRPFPLQRINRRQALSTALEMERLDLLDRRTKAAFIQSRSVRSRWTRSGSDTQA